MSRKAIAVVLTVLIAVSAVPTAAMATASNAQKQEASAYTGTHVQFDVKQNAVVDYQVGGTTMLDSVKVQAGSSGDTGGLFGGSLSLSSVTSIEGSALSLDATANAEATISASGSAKMKAHDNSHGILVVKSGENKQVVVANVSSGASASAESDQQVSVTTESGTKGTFIVVGEGSVTVNENGNVSAKLQANSKLVFRAYPDSKSDQAEQNEKLIASGKVAGEVYVEKQDGKMVTDTVAYTQKTSVKAEQSAESTVKMTVERSASKGKIVITSVSEAAVGSTSNMNVTVDGEAAAKVSSYSKLKGAIGSDSSAYMVKQASSASAKAQVYVAINHFSTKTVKMSGNGSGDNADSGNTSDGSDGSSGSSGGSVPGFGIGAALVAALGAALLAYRRQ
ncbi:PGF-CTERM sorting domain-containing protein [Halobacterium zhouii]|uniref:PGF-CTERM sorting domain-containing protein n=1 Tax=Halobacterium zhouii TaxID=2902624 RepID=UPI001E4DC693|nr:PGF-CTERM sorting domain-containing protein [Halobacterium zhouii]